ncbi:MAG: helix-turn-helix domain-containing protein [Muribaculaceae bacterium]|nr:helix-turn-helix domain-containing protein [Muribaculaceae bacterium]MDE6422021.1 helix-turn-helix domain-containing protein [Muribaculaceae bacterium]
MNSDIKIGTYTTLSEISKIVNSDKLDEDILVFQHEVKFVPEEIFPLRIDALLIALCTEGSGKIGIDLREYEIKKNTIIVIQPKNFIYLSNYSDDFKCSAVVCSNHVVEDVLPKLTEILPLLMHHRTEPVSYLSEEDANNISNFYDFLRKKLRGPKTPFLKQKVLCMLQAALYEMMDIHLQNSSGVATQRTRKEEIMAKFILAVSEHFREQRQVAYYAHKLFITPKHLSSVVKELSGRTAGDWIENYVVMEAKVLLKTTDRTIQEIALYLNFANQSFFGKYFKHHTGMSPTSYRKKYQ